MSNNNNSILIIISFCTANNKVIQTFCWFLWRVCGIHGKNRTTAPSGDYHDDQCVQTKFWLSLMTHSVSLSESLSFYVCISFFLSPLSFYLSVSFSRSVSLALSLFLFFSLALSLYLFPIPMNISPFRTKPITFRTQAISPVNFLRLKHTFFTLPVDVLNLSRHRLLILQSSWRWKLTRWGEEFTTRFCHGRWPRHFLQSQPSLRVAQDSSSSYRILLAQEYCKLTITVRLRIL